MFDVGDYVEVITNEMSYDGLIMRNYVRKGIILSKKVFSWSDEASEWMQTSVEAPYRFVHTFAKKFVANNKGHIINISSVMGTKVRETAGAYAGTKYAIEAVSEALRMELTDTNVKITCIEPGLVQTQLHRHWKKHPSELLGIPNPLKPEDIANIIKEVLSQPGRLYTPRIMVLPKSHRI